jgi:hypothetical protein
METSLKTAVNQYGGKGKKLLILFKENMWKKCGFQPYFSWKGGRGLGPDLL